MNFGKKQGLGRTEGTGRMNTPVSERFGIAMAGMMSVVLFVIVDGMDATLGTFIILGILAAFGAYERKVMKREDT